jgi:hypothetical protein
MTHNLNKQIEAVARVHSGESIRKVANDLRCGRTTIRRWLDAAERAETATEKELAERAEDLLELRRATRQQLIVAAWRRALEDIGNATAKEAATIAAIAEDKELLAEGRPTKIRAEDPGIPPDATPEQLVSIADELQRRREASPARAGRILEGS